MYCLPTNAVCSSNAFFALKKQKLIFQSWHYCQNDCHGFRSSKYKLILFIWTYATIRPDDTVVRSRFLHSRCHSKSAVTTFLGYNPPTVIIVNALYQHRAAKIIEIWYLSRFLLWLALPWPPVKL